MRYLALSGTKKYIFLECQCGPGQYLYRPNWPGLLYWWTKIMSRENAARRINASRKIRKAKHIDPEIKLAIDTILDLLSNQSAYNVAWPSAACLAKRQSRSRRTGQWYVKIIKEFGIFDCIQLPPVKAMEYCESRFGFRPKLDQCGQYGPNLYVVNPKHPLWDSSKSLPNKVDVQMGAIICKIKASRNAKTTSSFSSNPQKHPKHTIALKSNRTYCLKLIRKRIQITLERLKIYEDRDLQLLPYERSLSWSPEGI